MYDDLILEGRDILLKKASFEDWEDIYRNLWQHPESARYMLWDPTFTEKEAMDRMERTLAFQQKEKYAFFVYERSSGKAIGFAAMKETDRGVFDVMSIALGPAFTGRGYGEQALRLLIREAFEAGGEKVLASCRTENLPSHRLQRKCGLVFSCFEDMTDPGTGAPYRLENNVLTRDMYLSGKERLLHPASSEDP